MIRRQDSLLAHYQGFKETVLVTVRSAAFVEALRASSGPFSLAELAEAGHPYSRRRPNRAFDPTIINTQTGAFRESWQKDRVLLGAEESRTGVFNYDEKADWLVNGTETMVARRVDLRIERETLRTIGQVEKSAMRRMEQAWRTRKSL